jgi:hypothetical protein
MSQRGTGKADRVRYIMAEQHWNIFNDRKGMLVWAFQDTAIARKWQPFVWADKK